MFTGIIQSIGQILSCEARGGDLRVRIGVGALDLAGLREGDSVAVSGVCLTALDIELASFAADVSRETLDRSTLGRLAPGSAVNLELPLTPSTPLGGHFVSGHVDGIATVVAIVEDGRSQRWRFALPRELSRYVASKGSIAIEGVSLTVNEVEDDQFGVNLIPHTLARTTFGSLGVGAAVNIEIDLIARYVERLLATGRAQA